MCINKEEVSNYSVLNRYAKENSTVIIGSDYMHNIPIAELKQAFEINCDIYNRSLTGLTINESFEVLNDVIESLNPSKMLIQLGEIEVNNSSVEIESLITQLSDLIASVNKNKSIRIVLVSLANLDCSSKVNKFNTLLEKLARTTHCQFADINVPAQMEDVFHINAFRKLRFFLHDEISLTDSLNLI